jgi:predicted CXXCH cytochrome family protein
MVTPALQGSRSAVPRDEGNPMKPTRHLRTSLGAAAVACAAALLLAGCERGSAPRAARQASTAECTGTDAHTKHLKQFACETCHPTGGTFGFSGTLPGGLAVTGTIARADGVPPSCAVSCHAPDGGTPTPISWDAGPRTCGSCHVGRALVAGGTAHVAAAEQASCAGCHDLSQHMGGTVLLTGGMVPGTEAMCLRCHSGTGGSLAGGPGPLLVGWQDLAGDWHGARAGTGSGGTLQAPFARGAAALPCGSCHDEHASSNAFLFASSVNGSVVASDTIDRAGVGAEVLCASCHAGERHAWCISCHAGRVLGPDPMPAGSPCFYCHGHEGIVNFVPPSDYQHDGSEGDGPRCWHCHSNWAPPALEYVAPVVVNGDVHVNSVGFDSATIVWATDEPATGSVEWGTDGVLDRVNGPTALGTAHSVALTGLAPATTYSFRARSVDRFRNVSRSSLLTFQTAAPGAPFAPVLVDEPGYTSCNSPAVVTLEWLPAADPEGDPVQYRLLIDDSALFDSPLVDTGWTTPTSYTASIPVTLTKVTYFWRVQARDAAHDLASPWSPVDDFWLNRYRIGQCP